MLLGAKGVGQNGKPKKDLWLNFLAQKRSHRPLTLLVWRRAICWVPSASAHARSVAGKPWTLGNRPSTFNFEARPHGFDTGCFRFVPPTLATTQNSLQVVANLSWPELNTGGVPITHHWLAGATLILGGAGGAGGGSGGGVSTHVSSGNSQGLLQLVLPTARGCAVRRKKNFEITLDHRALDWRSCPCSQE